MATTATLHLIAPPEHVAPRQPRSAWPRGRALERAGLDTKIVEHEKSVMRNVTVTMDDDVARWVRVEAAKRGISVSRLLGDYVASMMRAEAGYEAAQADFLSRGPRRLRPDGQRLPTREELHER
jgi:hypothetical protein